MVFFYIVLKESEHNSHPSHEIIFSRMQPNITIYMEVKKIQLHRNGDCVKERFTSNSVKSLPPVIFHTIPVALSIPRSNKGD